ncbi:hypothetical protein C8T65DRAFT_636903 [Cerioporus squamosus]|nr:hypothetical protein C8T65DRAFT_636903 [Cerioporus squamosus]
MISRRRDAPSLSMSSSTCSPIHLLVATFAASLWIPRVLAAPATASDPSPSSLDIPPATTDIVSPSPPIQAVSSTHLSTYGIVGIVISGSLFVTVVIGYGLRQWRRYKRSRLPPSAQYRESVRVAAGEGTGAASTAGEGAPAASEGAETREVVAGGVGVSGAAPAGSRSSKSGPRRGERDLREKTVARSSESTKPTRGSERKARRESKPSPGQASGGAGPSAGPGPSTQASRQEAVLSGIEEVPR